MGSKPTRMILSLVDSVVRISLTFDFIVRLPIDYRIRQRAERTMKIHIHGDGIVWGDENCSLDYPPASEPFILFDSRNSQLVTNK